MIDNFAFGKRLENCMKNANISNVEITRALELNKNAIGNYKNGQIPNATILYKISNFLGISMEYLLAGKESGELTPEEQKLVDTFRSCSSVGQSIIQEQAEAIRQKLPADQTDQPAESSTSAIG